MVVTVRLDPALLRSVITPLLTVDGIVVPVIESIFASIVWTLSVRLSWLPVAPEATNEMGVPLTVMVSVSPKLAASESVPAAPDNSVAPVIGAGVVAWLLTAVPAIPSGGWEATAPKPSAANAAEFELDDGEARAAVVVQRDHAVADGRRGRGAGNRIDLREQRLDAVGDVDLVAGRAGGDKGDGGAVDGDGVAGRETGTPASPCPRHRTTASRR